MQGVFQQGQLAILLHLNEIDIRLRNKLKFYKGPAGCKEFPPLSEFTHEKLTERGWEQVLVPFECSQATRIGSMLLGRRTQYGVRLRVASTIHACQGATFSKLVTAVTNLPGSDLNFTLWEAAQVIVLISRTRRCSDIYFVGDEHEVANRLVETLCETGRYLRHIQALTKRLCGELDATPVLERPPIFRPCDMVLDRELAVYLLVSTKHAGFMYIGETEDIRKRLNDHNSGNGSKFTNNSRLRPWALFGFVIGFGNRSQRRLFEQRWKHRAREDRNSERRRNPAGVLQIAIDLAIAKNRTRLEHSKLLVRQCGEMVDQQQPCVLVES
jgi:predicted GIY-YIG superfamily endonuclease